MAETPVYNPNDGLVGRDGGPYLDEEQARNDEIRRAKIEGREPDFDKPGANAGIQLSTAGQMLATITTQGPVSRERARTLAFDELLKTTGEEISSPVADTVPDTSKQKTADDANELVFNETDPNAPLTSTSKKDAGKDGTPVKVVSSTSDKK
jgi:hypothetical protein